MGERYCREVVDAWLSMQAGQGSDPEPLVQKLNMANAMFRRGVVPGVDTFEVPLCGLPKNRQEFVKLKGELQFTKDDKVEDNQLHKIVFEGELEQKFKKAKRVRKRKK